MDINPANKSSQGPSSPSATVRRLPGKARPQTEALREYQEFNSRLRDRIPAPLWAFFAPDPEEFYRWRIQLTCDCIKEVLTKGPDDLPSQIRWPEGVYGARLPAGQIVCTEHKNEPPPYRDIINWKDRREHTFPADPVDPPDDMYDPQVWAVIRHNEPHTSAFWRVELSCGHVSEVCTDSSWNPADGPRLADPERLRKMVADFESSPTLQVQDDQGIHEHMRRMLDLGWPTPQPDTNCHACVSVRYIVAYQRVGWLIPKKAEPKKPKPPSHTSLQRRLKQKEAEAEQLRSELARLDAESSESREAP